MYDNFFKENYTYTNNILCFRNASSNIVIQRQEKIWQRFHNHSFTEVVSIM